MTPSPQGIAHAGKQLALLGANTAAMHADRVTHGTWSREAWDFLVRFGLNSKGKSFNGEDVRVAARGIVPEPPDARAWGAILVRAAKGRLMRRIGYAPVRDPKCHARPMAVWVWVGQ